MDLFSAFVGIIWMAGGAFFIWAPGSRWYQRRLTAVFGDRAAEIVEERRRWYRMIGYAVSVIGLVRLVTS